MLQDPNPDAGYERQLGSLRVGRCTFNVYNTCILEWP